MNTRLWLFGLCFSAGFLPCSAIAVTDDANSYILNSGETAYLSGTIYKNQKIIINPGAIVRLPTTDPNDTSKWSLQLIAPTVHIGGTILGQGSGYNDVGLGVSGQGNTGSGGSGYGGKGGDGENNPSSGGSAYDTSYRERIGTSNSNDIRGGGGSIRIDAISLSLGATALINASAYPSANLGGASGGCILLNGIETYLMNGYQLRADGGPGRVGYYKFIVYYPGCGGGGGGRIKIFKYPNSPYVLFHDYGGTTTVAGGLGGGGLSVPATNGANGTVVYYGGIEPSQPTLLSPDNGQKVGTAPTFNFISTDSPGSQFFQYYLQVSLDSTFPNPLTHTADQRFPDAGWEDKLYYKSGQMASYTMPWDLAPDTTYYWRVKVTSSCGFSWSYTSAYRSFTTAANARPLKPIILNPVPDPVQSNVSKTPPLPAV